MIKALTSSNSRVAIHGAVLTSTPGYQLPGVQSKDNPADLIKMALDELVRQRCELPGYTTVQVMTVVLCRAAGSGRSVG